MKSKYPKADIARLDEIYWLIYSDAALAVSEAEKMMRRYKSDSLTYMYARAQLVYFAANISMLHSRRSTINAGALKNYFETNGHKEEAALLTLWFVRSKYADAKYEEARALDEEYDKLYSTGAPLHNRLMSLTGKANFYLRDHNRTGQLELALQAETLLSGVEEKDAWHQAMLSTVLQIKAEALSRVNEPEKSRAAADEAIAAADIPGVSPQFIFTAYHYRSSTASNDEKIEESLHYLLELEKKMAGHPAYRHLLVNVFLGQAFLYDKLYQEKPGGEQMRQGFLKATMQSLEKLDQIPEYDMQPKLQGYAKLMKARLLRALGRHSEAIPILAQALRIFYRNRIWIHVLDTFVEAGINYDKWGRKENNVRIMQKAFLVSRQALDAIFVYNRDEGKEKMDAIINKYELKQKELSEKLLQQKVEAMNKEIQLTSLSLHEKVTVLDELKQYVSTLKQKGKETGQLVNLISKKIDKVILTEQEKSALQQKIDDGNTQFYKILAEKFPALTNLEIHICGLLKTGMTDKELSKIYGLTDKSYEQHRYRIKKKIKLGREENLVKYLKSLDSGPKE